MSAVGSKPERRLAGFFGLLTAVLLAMLALVCGYVGLLQATAASTHYGRGPFDLLYYDVQLFVLSSPPVDDNVHLPLLLQIARFAAPFVTVYTIIEAGRRIFASELSLLRIRRARGHVVVCGEGSVADALAARLIRERQWVVRIAERGGSGMDSRSWHFLLGDPTSAVVLRAAAVWQARALYVCTTDSAVNLAVALAVSGLDRRAHGALDVHVRIDDPELCLALQARRLGLPSPPRLHVNFFSSHELAARTLVRTHEPPSVVDRPASVMIVGASPFAMALVVELARHWRARTHGGSKPLGVVLVDPHAEEEIARLHRRYLFLETTCHFTPYQVNVENLLDGDLPDTSPDRVYLCGEDEEAALKLALTMDQFWHQGPRTVVVRLSRLGLLERAFHAEGDRLLDDVSGRLYLFDAVRAGSDADLVEDSLVERLGRAVHENYVLSRLSEGADPTLPGLRPWHELSEDLRAANRAQAADVGRKLRAIGCALAPSPIWGEPQLLDDAAVEQLAEMEHERWYRYMIDDGWRFSLHRDNVARLHPDLIPWADLAYVIQEKNREAVREIPMFLADAGFQIVRVGNEPLPAEL